MVENALVEEILAFFKALADANRLKIIALLAKEPLSVEQLAGMLGLNSSTISHHLSKLAKTGLVSARAESYYSVYQLELQVLKDLSQRLLSKEVLPAVAADVDIAAYDRKVLNTYLSSDGRLQAFPAQRKKQAVILRHIVQVFEPDRRYSEKQVKNVLANFSDDTASLRRNLVAFGLMKREGGGGDYWRAEKEKEKSNPFLLIPDYALDL
jgi:predicted transcriptional regulator